MNRRNKFLGSFKIKDCKLQYYMEFIKIPKLLCNICQCKQKIYLTSNRLINSDELKSNFILTNNEIYDLKKKQYYYSDKNNKQKADKAQYGMPNRILQLCSPNSKSLLKTNFNISTFLSYINLILILISLLLIINFYSIQCLASIINYNIETKECKQNNFNNENYQIIEPMVVINNKQHQSSEKKNSTINNYDDNNNNNNNYDEPTNIKLMRSLPLSAKIGCPNTMRIYFSGFKDKFVIDLIKNKRLISDTYFQISRDNINRHGRHPDSSTKQLISNKNENENENDDKFYENNLFLNLHNFTTNEDHCHYHGYVNDNLNSISAISIVNNKLLNGFFHDGNDIYYLHSNITNLSTILTKSIKFCNDNNSLIEQQDNEIIKINNRFNLIQTKDSKILDEKTNDYLKITKQLHRSRRAIKNRRSSKTNSDNFIKHDPFQSNSSSLFVELLIVHDHSQFIEYKRNTSLIAERTMQIVNIMNAFYRQLNIFISLVGVVLWTEKDEIELTNDGDSTLTNFLKYRYEKLLPKYHHDNAQLITSTSFNGSVVGKALKGPICTHEHSGGVNTDHSHSPAIVAVTLAHELGHNLGMEHDEDDKCKCPDEKCIMSSSSSTVHPKHWSTCSIDYLEDSRKHGLLDCLVERPTKVFGPICGNGFVEEGEDCDLGEALPSYGTSKSKKQQSTSIAINNKCLNGFDCELKNSIKTINNPCCDRQTCKFIGNATCAQGPCCDLNNCSIYDKIEIKVCRHKRTECDFEEICDGKSEYCPTDVHYHDGIECGPGINSITDNNEQENINNNFNFNRSRAFCYNGKCASHESQCQLLWGSSGSVSKDICYEQNVHGNTSGNCGYNRKEKFYNTCEQEDAICGMLHCIHDQQITLNNNNGVSQINGDLTTLRKTGKLNYGFESASILTVSFFVMSNNAKIYCNGAIIDAGPNVRDPGLVPDGAYCGDEKMCLNQKCVPINDIIYKNWCPSDCNGNGICDNMGICHCNDGTIGTSCYQFFGSNFHLSLFLYMIMFFVPIIALIVITINHYKKQIKIWWFLHKRRIELKNKALDPNYSQRRIRVHVNHNDRHKLSISDPIPLNQQNVNIPFYDQNTNDNLTRDVWAETNCESVNHLNIIKNKQ